MMACCVCVCRMIQNPDTAVIETVCLILSETDDDSVSPILFLNYNFEVGF